MEMKSQHFLISLHLAWLDTMNFMLCVLLESIDLMWLKFTKQEQKAIGSSENFLVIADCIVTYRLDKVYSYG